MALVRQKILSVPHQNHLNLLPELLFCAIESLHTDGTAHRKLGVDVAIGVGAPRDCAQITTLALRKQCAAMAAADSVSRFHSRIVFYFLLTIQSNGAFVSTYDTNYFIWINFRNF